MAEQTSSSQNRFLEPALPEDSKRARRELLRREFAEASRDPLFLADVKLVERDFSHTDAEPLELIA